jgi:hypothetical protein
MGRQAKGLDHYSFLERLHACLLFDWYMEIGCRKGDSFAPVRGKTIAVDPFFRARIDIIGQKPALHVFQSTGDDFFASGFLGRNGIRLALSFLDGLHLFDALLRDFIAAEAASDPNRVIMLHDCVPYGFAMTTRDLANLPEGAWTGDVWKLIPILQKWRPDLRLTVLDCAPSGLVCVTGLQPGDTTLRDAYDAICAEFIGFDIRQYGSERFYASFDLTSAEGCAAGGFQLFRPASIDSAAALTPRLIST